MPEELEQLRFDPLGFEGLTIKSGEQRTLDVSGDSLELQVEVASPGTVGVSVCASLDGDEATRISYDARMGLLRVDTRRSGTGPKRWKRPRCG